MKQGQPLREQNSTLAGPPVMEQVKRFYRLQVRWDERLEQEMEKVSGKEDVKWSTLALEALFHFHHHYRKGYIHFGERSDFHFRAEKPEKVTKELLLNAYQRNMLRNLAFASERSSAECLRLALEWYIYVFKSDNIFRAKTYHLKNHYKQKKPVAGLIIMSLFDIQEIRFHTTDTIPPFSCHFY